jgi:hypothetical protein
MPSLAGFTRLRHLALGDCAQLKFLWSRLPRGLQNIRVFGCPMLDSLSALTQCHGLIELSVERCPALARLPVLPARLQSLNLSACPALVALVELPPSLRKLSLHGCDALQTLNLDGLVRLEALHVHRRSPHTRLGPLRGLVNLSTLSTRGVRVRLTPEVRARLTTLVVDGVADLTL